MDTSRALAADAFLAAFASSSDVETDTQLQALLISAVVECAGPTQVHGLLARVHDELDAVGRFESDAQRARWRWLLLELRLIEDIDTKRFDAGVTTTLARLQHRIENDNDPATVWPDKVPHATVTNSETADSTQSLAWLRRLLSGETDVGTRDSVLSMDHDTKTDSTRPSQSQTATELSDVPVLQRNSSAVSDSVVAILRSFTTRIGMSMEETLLCQICFEHVPVVDGVQLTECGHPFCASCIRTYLELKIADGQVYPLCFHETEAVLTEPSSEKTTGPQPSPTRKACGAPIIPSDIESLVSLDVWKKYLMFKFNKENAYGRQCPYCSASQLCAGPEHPLCVCTACARPFCFTHGNAHEHSTCADFELKQVEQEKLNRSAIAEIAKPCPGCKSNVEKSGGCNHMKCVVCNTDFCWICGAVVDSNIAPLHFQWWNLRGCAGQQMEEVDAQTPSERFWMSVVRVAMVVFLGPPALAITLILTATSCCCVPCVAGFQLSFRECFTTCLNFVVLGLLLMVTGISVAVMFVCSVVFEICSYPFKHISSCSHCRAPPAPTLTEDAPSEVVVRAV